jgi:hypothetical protein
MRHMEIQHGKEGMKTKKFNAEVGATAGCTLRLLLDSITEEDKGISIAFAVMPSSGVFGLQVRLPGMVMRQFSRLSRTTAFILRLLLRRP